MLPHGFSACIISGMAEQKPKTSPRDFFLNLLSIVALYVSATSFGVLIFQYINILVPDVLDFTRYGSDAYRAVRFPIASLFILFPVYIWTAWYLEKEYKREPQKREVAIRKWLVYLTLFAAAVAIIGDSVALVFTFLNGEITARFILKILTILLIAGSVFYYYLSGLRSKRTRNIKLFVYGVISVVAISVLASFFVVGSPTEQRARRLDERRVNDLQLIQSETIIFWQNKDRLPEKLSELTSDIRGIRVPVDPETGEEYVYNVLGDNVFELCGTFTSDSEGGTVQIRSKFPGVGVGWEHGVGEVCFERVIDKDFFSDEKPIIPRPIYGE